MGKLVTTPNLTRHEQRLRLAELVQLYRRDVLDVYRRAIFVNGAHFLDVLQDRMPSPAKAIQVYGGSEFEVDFSKRSPGGKSRSSVLPSNALGLDLYVKRLLLRHLPHLSLAYLTS